MFPENKIQLNSLVTCNDLSTCHKFILFFRSIQIQYAGATHLWLYMPGKFL